MASAPFAPLESRLNRAVLSRLANTQVTIGAAAVDAVFDNGYATATVGPYGVASSQPALTLSSEYALPVGDAITVNGTAYVVSAHEPDGTGISRLMLEVAP